MTHRGRVSRGRVELWRIVLTLFPPRSRYHRAAPRAGGLIESLGSCEWAALETDDRLVHEVERRVGDLVGCPAHKNDGGVKLSYTHYGQQGGDPRRAPDGSHLDTNKRPHRFVTVLIYLNDVHHGGETVFPLAGCSPALLGAATDLAEAGMHHTQDAPKSNRLKVCAGLVDRHAEDAAAGKCGAKVAPRKGTACVFYGINPAGAVEPASFHFGATLTKPCAGKWTIQYFKELPAEVRHPAGREGFAGVAHPGNRR